MSGFQREARSCGRLQHANIVTIYDLGEESQTAYIAMELLNGLDFRKVIDQKYDLPVIQKLELMAQVCDALGHAHRHGVIHRDVKPSNLFFTEAGSVKVLDFGIARLTSSRLTVAGKILGTPNYMAPEQILATQCDGRADIFSAGVVFFEFLVYKHPFRGSMIPQRIVESDPDSLFDHQSNLPPVLEKVFARALAKKPEDRYPNAAVFAADLRTVLESIRQNAPTANIELPSDRPEIFASEPLAGNYTVEAAVAPEGEDSAEWRNSEVLMLIPQFEKAVERNDHESAQTYFDSLLRVTVADGRFSEAVAGCRARLDQLQSSLSDGVPTEASIPSTPPSSSRNTQKVCLECGTGNRSVARFCLGCGANLDEPTPVGLGDHTSLDGGAKTIGKAPIEGISDTLFDRTAIYTPDTKPEPIPADKTLIARSLPNRMISVLTNGGVYSKSLAWIRAHYRFLIPAVLILLAAIVVTGILIPKTYPIETPVAAADVAVPKLDVHVAEDDASKRIYTLRQGDRLKVLDLPKSFTQKWLRVQYVGDGRAKQAGYARRASLTPLEGLSHASALILLKLQFDNGDESESHLRARINAFKIFLVMYSGTSSAAAAAADITETEAKIERLFPKNPSVPLLADPVEKLREAEQLFRDRRYNDALKVAQDFSTEHPENEGVKPLIQAILEGRRASYLRSAARFCDVEARYDEAEKLVERVLREDKNNNEAKSLLERIKKARDLEKR